MGNSQCCRTVPPGAAELAIDLKDGLESPEFQRLASKVKDLATEGKEQPTGDKEQPTGDEEQPTGDEESTADKEESTDSKVPPGSKDPEISLAQNQSPNDANSFDAEKLIDKLVALPEAEKSGEGAPNAEKPIGKDAFPPVSETSSEKGTTSSTGTETPTRTVAESFQKKLEEEKVKKEEQQKKQKEAAKVLRSLETKGPAFKSSLTTTQGDITMPKKKDPIFRKGTAMIRDPKAPARADTVANKKQVLQTAVTLEPYTLTRAMTQPPPRAPVPVIKFEPKKPSQTAVLDDANAAHESMLKTVFSLADKSGRGKLEAKELGILREFLMEFTGASSDGANKLLLSALGADEDVMLSEATFIELVDNSSLSRTVSDRFYAQTAVKADVDSKAKSVGAIFAKDGLMELAKSEFKQFKSLDSHLIDECVGRLMTDADFEVTKEEFYNFAKKFFNMLRTLTAAQWISFQRIYAE